MCLNMDVCVLFLKMIKTVSGKLSKNPSVSWELFNSSLQWEDKYRAVNLSERAAARLPAGHREDTAAGPALGEPGQEGRRRTEQTQRVRSVLLAPSVCPGSPCCRQQVRPSQQVWEYLSWGNIWTRERENTTCRMESTDVANACAASVISYSSFTASVSTISRSIK